jgi:nicotinate-nucleotide adenylyltransferase
MPFRHAIHSVMLSGMNTGLPFTTPGQRIGLLGGSFDPPHAGHVHITCQAMRRFGLDRVWWIVSPGNPLKAARPADFKRRLAACRALVQHPRIIVSDFEARIGTRYTAETLARLMVIKRDVDFVWLMGADNLAQFHHWENWRGIMHSLPIGVLARPDDVVAAGLSPAAQTYRQWRLRMAAAKTLPGTTPPCWSLVTGAMVDMSSTKLRNSGEWIR